MPRHPNYGKFSNAEFIALYKELQSADMVAKHMGISVATVGQRRRRLEKDGIMLPQYDKRPAYNRAVVQPNRAIVNLSVADGAVLVGSDAHIWPGPRTTMQRAFIEFARRLKPVAVIANGDFFDGATVSRWPSIGWEEKPTVQQELEAVQDYMGELTKAAGKCARLWPLGNHDARLENRIAAVMPELRGVRGAHLKDHFEEWTPCWRVDINDNVVVRHRENGGEHADHNNVVKSGKTIVTGHDHRANVTAWSDYTGTRWGVRCGYMADSPQDPQFINYLEGRAPNWVPAFAVLTFRKGRLLWPELAVKHDDDHVQFRGEVIAV